MPHSKSAKAVRPMELRLTPSPTETQEMTLAQAATDPAVRAATTTLGFIKPCLGDRGLMECLEALKAQIEDARTSLTRTSEHMLIAQASTLDAIFNEMARRVAQNMGAYVNAAEIYLRLALKAQSQCRMTLETLATIKQPSVIFTRQANLTTGPQQVNNNEMTLDPRARNEKTPTELSGGEIELSEDARTSSSKGRND